MTYSTSVPGAHSRSTRAALARDVLAGGADGEAEVAADLQPLVADDGHARLVQVGGDGVPQRALGGAGRLVLDRQVDLMADREAAVDRPEGAADGQVRQAD